MTARTASQVRRDIRRKRMQSIQFDMTPNNATHAVSNHLRALDWWDMPRAHGLAAGRAMRLPHQSERECARRARRRGGVA